MAREMLSVWKAVSAKQEEAVAGIRADCRQSRLSPQGRGVDAAPHKSRWAVHLGVGGAVLGTLWNLPAPVLMGVLQGKGCLLQGLWH